MDLKLKGQKAIITGATKGIGRAIADTLADEGCNVAICARNEGEVAAAVEALQAKGVTAFGQSVDVGDGDALKAWVDASAEALGGIDCLVSNVSGGNSPGGGSVAVSVLTSLETVRPWTQNPCRSTSMSSSSCCVPCSLTSTLASRARNAGSAFSTSSSISWR